MQIERPAGSTKAREAEPWKSGRRAVTLPLREPVRSSERTRDPRRFGEGPDRGNLNTIWLSLYPIGIDGPAPFYSVTLPRGLHDLFALYGIVFWIWQVIDAWRLASRAMRPTKGAGTLPRALIRYRRPPSCGCCPSGAA